MLTVLDGARRSDVPPDFLIPQSPLKFLIYTCYVCKHHAYACKRDTDGNIIPMNETDIFFFRGRYCVKCYSCQTAEKIFDAL